MPCRTPPAADQQWVEGRLNQLRQEEKRLIAALADQGAGPQRVGPGMLNAMLTLNAAGGPTG
jgi:hypothetical protein